MRSVTKLLAPLLALSTPLLALIAPGCSLVVEAENKQCSNDADCQGLGPDFEGTFCNAQSVCQNVAEYCRTNEECQQRTGVSSYVCLSDTNRCVDLLTPECPKLLADPGDLLAQPPPLILGHHGFASTGLPLLAGENALELARQEFARNAGGLPGASPARPVVIVSCDSSIMSMEQHKAANDHLMQTLRVPIVFGPGPSSWAQYTVPEARENDVLTITVGADTIDAKSDLRKGIFFRNNFSQEKGIAAQTDLVEKYIEPKVRQEKGMTPDQPVRVAMVYSDEGSSPTNGVLFFQNARFNGKSAAENGDNYRQFNMGSLSRPDFQATLSAMVLQVAEFQPHIVVTYDGIAVDDAVNQIEDQLPGFPHYLVANTGVEQPLIDKFANDETKRRHIWITQSGQPSTYPNYRQFLITYEAAFPNGGKGPVAGAVGAPQYDQYYLAMYALAAHGLPQNPKERISGAALGKIWMTRFNSGKDIQLGPLYIGDAVATLQQGGNIIYHGANTTSLFNEYGDVSPPTLILCFSKDATAPNRMIETGVYRNPDTGEFVGTDTCDNE